MSDPPPRSRPEAPRLHPLLAILIGLVGILLLLPGLCALIFAIGFGGEGLSLIPLWLICLLISAGGIALLRRALR